MGERNFRDRSPLNPRNMLDRNGGGRFRPDIRPAPNFGLPGRLGDRHTPRLDDRAPRLDWRDRESDFVSRFDDLRGSPGGFGARPNLPDLRPSAVRSDFPPVRSDFPPVRPLDRPDIARSGPIDGPRWQEPVAPPKSPLDAIPPKVSTDARTNDVEIIVTNKSLTGYAEYIERRLKKMGLTVDLLFPNEEVPLGRVLGNIASRGTLYAIVVTQISEERRSVTVNFLYGQTQEHRNIPLDEGFQLIIRNYEAHLRGERMPVKPAPGGVPVNSAGVPLGGNHPDIIYSLLNLLVNNKPLTVTQYDKIIAYLQEKREEQVKLEVGDGITNAGDGNMTNVQAQLQDRILNLLQSTDQPKTASDPLMGNASSLMKDPALAKALENIVQNNILRGVQRGQSPNRNFSPFVGGRK